MTVERAFDPDSEPAGEVVLEAVAVLENTEPAELSQPLHASVDSDALDSLVSHGGAMARVTFSYLGYHVAVESSGVVSVAERTEP